MSVLKHIGHGCLLVYLMVSCSVTKYIPEDQTLYKGANLKLVNDFELKGKKALGEELENFIKPEPNKKAAGIRLGALLHYRSQSRKIYFISKFLNKKIGEEPVYMDQVKPERTLEILNNRLENKGFYNAQITYNTSQKKKYASLTYEIRLQKPYLLKAVTIGMDTTQIHQDLKECQQNTLLTPGNRFDLDLFKQERERIDTELKNAGYYYFNAQYLIFEVDTNQTAHHEFEAYLRLKENVPAEALKKYTLEDIVVHPNYTIDLDSISQTTQTLEGISFVQKKLFFEPNRLLPFIFLEKGMLYSPRKSKITSERLSNIGTYKYVNIKYQVLDTSGMDSGHGALRAEILLSPLPRYSITAQLQALSKSNNFIGPALNLSFSNHNVFGGGEVWSVSSYGGYEFQLLNGDEQDPLSSTQVGLSTDLVFPRLLSPIKLIREYKHSVPKTKMRLGYERLRRGDLFQLNTFNTRFGYLWKENPKKFHELNPINVNFVRLSNVSQEFNDILDQNLFLKNSFRQEFIAGITYSFTYNELNEPKQQYQQHQQQHQQPFFLAINVDLAGNLLSALNRTIGQGNGQERIFGLEYAQYAKLDVDLRQYLKFKDKRVLIARFFGGIALPYGNSNFVPFSKQFFAGGPFSVRAFRIHALGPGRYQPNFEDIGSFFDQSGDVKLEANLEYRFPIVSIIEGALFVDAGNVWLLNANVDLPGGEFTADFLNQLGAGTGLGIRANIQNFAIRLDWGVPFLSPFDRRVALEPKKSVLNFAIGYPF